MINKDLQNAILIGALQGFFTYLVIDFFSKKTNNKTNTNSKKIKK